MGIDLAMANGHTMTVDEALTLAEHFARSGYFADAKQASQAVVKIIAGRELGIGPMAAMSGIHLVQGKPALSAGLIGALIARSGRYRYQVIRGDDTGCELEWFRDGQSIGRSSFTIEDAKRASLADKDIWKKYPSDLCFARALTRGARRYCPDVSMGPAYTPEELGGGMMPDVAVDHETGEIIDVTPALAPDDHPEPELAGTDDFHEEPPEHWSPLIDAATTKTALCKLIVRIGNEEQNEFRRAGALRKASARLPELTDLDGLLAAAEWAEGRPQLPLNREMATLWRQAADALAVTAGEAA